MDSMKKAALTVGAVAGVGAVVVFGVPFWAGILIGGVGAALTPRAIDAIAKREGSA